ENTANYALSLHDALPISPTPMRARRRPICWRSRRNRAELSQLGRRPVVEHAQFAGLRPQAPKRVVEQVRAAQHAVMDRYGDLGRSEEHTSELQSLAYLVC